MGTFFAYAIQSSVCLILFYLFYKALLSHETFHRFNRMALLGIMLLSFAIPFMLTLFPIRETPAIQPHFSGMVDELSTAIRAGDPVVEHAKNEARSALLALFLLIYLTGCAVCLIYITLSTLRIVRMIRGGTCYPTPCGTKLIILPDRAFPPFSWMKYVVCSKHDYEEAGETIITHENAHIQLYHSLDLLLAQAGIITQWFNPAAWLLYRELQHIHEFEADEAVIHKGIDARQYQLLLIKKTVGARLYSIANSLNHSNLKKRIAMMYQKKSNPYARLKYASVLPLAAIAVALFAQPEISEPFAEISSAKVSHFSFKTSKNEVRNLPESDSPVAAESSEGGAAFMPWSNEDMQHAAIQADDSIYRSVEKMPQFPGGEEAIMKWINDNMKYPEEAQKNRIQGRVFCQFVVEKDGSVTNVEVVRGINPLLDEEAVRTLKTVPKFIPGEEKGERVRVRYSVPVRFQFSNGTNNEDNQQSAPKIRVDSIRVNDVWYPMNEIDPAKLPADYIYTSAEKMPQFPGGEAALMKWINEKMKYPEEAQKNRLQGRVFCQFVVEKDGSVTNIEVTRGAHPLLDDESVRTLQTLPKFMPGEIKGQPVRVHFSVPVLFVLSK